MDIYSNLKKRKLICFLFLALCFLFLLEIYFPKNPFLAESKVFLIEKGQSAFQIGENLEKEGLIKNKFIFQLYVFLTMKAGKLQAGDYLLNSSMNIPQIAKKFVSGETYQVKVTIPEGFTLKQIETELSQKLQTTTLPPPSSLREAPRTVLGQFQVGDFKEEFDFLKDTPQGASLEGFLFPDTYYFSLSESDKEIFKKFLANFDKKLSLDLRKEIKTQWKTIFEIVTMASLIEKEVRTKEDKKLVSGILWKRLENRMPLQVDATIIYITGEKTTSPEGVASQPYGARVSKEETQIDSPYNTYKYKGLPIGPICNPGLESIKAALYPENSDYWYYLSTPEGKTIFSKTLEEHNIAKAKYLKN